MQMDKLLTLTNSFRINPYLRVITSFRRKTESFVEIRIKYFVSSLNFPRIKKKFPKTCPILTLHRTEGVFTITFRHFTPAKQFPILNGFSDILEKKNIFAISRTLVSISQSSSR